MIEVRTVEDVLKVPPDQLEAFAAELVGWARMHHQWSPGLVPVVLRRDVMVWTPKEGAGQ